MIDIRDLKVGDKFVVVSTRSPRMNCLGGADHWIGSVMTVREVRIESIKAVEDIGEHAHDGWFWHNESINWEATERLLSIARLEERANALELEASEIRTIIEKLNIPVYELGTVLKIIDGGVGAWGCNGEVGIVTDKPSTSGLFNHDMPAFNVELKSGKVWCVNSRGKFEVLSKWRD